MSRSWHLLLAGLALAVCTAGAFGHELKVLASGLVVPGAGERTTVYLSWGHVLPVDDLVDAAAIERYDCIARDGSVRALKKEGLSLQANVVEIQGEGVHQVLVSRRPAIITFVVDKDNNRVMKRGPKSSVQEGIIDHGLRSQQFAKALLVAGQSEGSVVKAAGQAFEIVPLEGPAQWRSNASMRF